jgi:glyoxylase-like metal-dependent hydrolase (beta-lactamase superfamily II)
MNIETDLKRYGIYTLIIPSIFPTGDTRCFAAEGEDGWALIDVGVSIPQARELWESFLREIGISFHHIRSIYLTHNHPDHCGIAGWLQQQSDAQVFLPRKDLPALAKYKLPENEQIEQIRADMAPYGIADKMIVRLVQDIMLLLPFFKPYPEITPLDGGDTFRFGDDVYTTYNVPGHSDGHVVFLGKSHKRLFSGDAFLADRVSQISDWPYSTLEDPLTTNMQALKRIMVMEPAQVLSAHGPMFEAATERLSEIEKLHLRRMTKVLKTLTGEMTLPELCLAIDVKARVLQEFRVSWADTRAYLEYLWRQGLIAKSTEGIIHYRISQSRRG